MTPEKRLCYSWEVWKCCPAPAHPAPQGEWTLSISATTTSEAATEQNRHPCSGKATSSHLSEGKICIQTAMHAASDARGQDMVRRIRGRPTICTPHRSLVHVPGHHQ